MLPSKLPSGRHREQDKLVPQEIKIRTGNLDSSDSDSESEDELHCVMEQILPLKQRLCLHPEAETFNPCLRNEDVVDPVNMETADQIDVKFTPASERRECQNKPVEPETRSTQEDRS